MKGRNDSNLSIVPHVCSSDLRCVSSDQHYMRAALQAHCIVTSYLMGRKLKWGCTCILIHAYAARQHHDNSAAPDAAAADVEGQQQQLVGIGAPTANRISHFQKYFPAAAVDATSQQSTGSARIAAAGATSPPLQSLLVMRDQLRRMYCLRGLNLPDVRNSFAVLTCHR